MRTVTGHRVLPELGEEGFAQNMNMGFDKLVEVTIRRAILEKGFRPDGRGVEDLRPLSAEVGVLPVVHGTGLFTRGETQALVVTTLGGPQDAQEGDSLYNYDPTRKFYLHYNFPNYSVGEVGRISAESEAMRAELSRCISDFLRTLRSEDRKLFVRRYWYGEDMSALAGLFGISENSAAVKLFRVRQKMKSYLEKEGFTV